jgi:predicted RNA-binding protein with PIN domain
MPPQTILLVDGYNVIGNSTHLQNIVVSQDLEAARRELIELMINYSAFVGYLTKVVFDAQYQDTAGYCEDQTKNLAVCYTDFGQTADTYIEKFCADFRRHRLALQRLIVATSDRAQQLTVVGYGAEWLSSNQLCNLILDGRSRAHRHHQADHRSRSRLIDSLDAKTRQKLARLRHGL